MVTKSEQVASLAKWLDSPDREEMTVEEVAKYIITSVYELIERDRKEQPPTLRVGVAFKDLVSNKVYHVAWGKDDLYWIISSDSRYGYLGPLTDSWKKYASETRAKSGAPGNNSDGWKQGDRVSFGRFGPVSTVLCVGDKTVLIQSDDEYYPQAEPNETMKKYFKKVD